MSALRPCSFALPTGSGTSMQLHCNYMIPPSGNFFSENGGIVLSKARCIEILHDQSLPG